MIALLLHALIVIHSLHSFSLNVVLHGLIDLELLDDVEGLGVLVVPDSDGLVYSMLLDICT